VRGTGGPGPRRSRTERVRRQRSRIPHRVTRAAAAVARGMSRSQWRPGPRNQEATMTVVAPWSTQASARSRSTARPAPWAASTIVGPPGRATRTVCSWARWTLPPGTVVDQG
jgi:hypothetical protein